MRSKPATIDDVARKAGVSRAAVSKVLRDAYGTSEAMREKVEAAIAALDYRPQMAARALRGRTFTLGVMLPDIRNPLFPMILDGIEERLAGTNYQTLLGVRSSANMSERHAVLTLLDRKVDGFVMVGPSLEPEFLAGVAARVPTVIVGSHDKGLGFDTVNDDDLLGADLAVRHLAELGHCRICHVGLTLQSAEKSSGTQLRAKGYLATMARLGLGRESLILDSSFDYRHEHQFPAFDGLLAGRHRPTALFAWTDLIAVQLIAALEDRGLSVPGDMSVVGYDDTLGRIIPQMKLTSVSQDGFELGRRATDLFLERLKGREEETHIVLPPALVVGNTTARAAI